AINVFARNLSDLLLAAPAGSRATMGLDPGLRTGVKVAVVDATGKLLETATIYPHVPQRQWDAALETLARLLQKHHVGLVSIGNGTASRETEKLVQALQQRHQDLAVTAVMVSEAGASVYSASALAAAEFPDVDVSLRGAVSIARRLQDPLAELVKIDPKSIGVGQYQHDVSQSKLQRALTAVVEDCVNSVGVDVNTASVALLTHVAGLNPTLAANMVSYRDAHGRFANRQELLQVARLGPKAYEQCAGFLRIRDGDNPLDCSAVHPEAYPVVKRIQQKTGKSVVELIGDSKLLSRLAANDFTDAQFGEPTVRDIIAELEKPGRDPRPEFKTATFREGVETLADLTPGMILEGVVTNVTHFGAFVDIGVHQDGLVHISALADKFVSDAHQVVKAGSVVKVKVLEVDLPRKRVALTMRLNDEVKNRADLQPVGGKDVPSHALPRGKGRERSAPQPQSQPPAPAIAGALAAALKRAGRG
ncbi:MAG: helix-hairpin-helix domain-containing protein, partial [Gammaproteobacteria bacterium]|nr:helix-hairpin-helix domain-containing protein [Gammaproteobacteria bacterium]